jgi:hypothetical protein
MAVRLKPNRSETCLIVAVPRDKSRVWPFIATRLSLPGRREETRRWLLRRCAAFRQRDGQQASRFSAIFEFDVPTPRAEIGAQPQREGGALSR